MFYRLKVTQNFSMHFSRFSWKMSEVAKFGFTYIVGNKADRRIAKRVSQENKARHIFRKTPERVRIRV